MGDFLHRVTKQHLISTSPNDLLEPIGNYIDTPDLSVVAGFPNIYWIITGDIISLMSQVERDAVDTTIETAQRDGQIAEDIDRLESVLRQLVKMIVSELNILRSLHGLPNRTLVQVRNQLRSGLGT